MKCSHIGSEQAERRIDQSESQAGPASWSERDPPSVAGPDLLSRCISVNFAE